MDQLIALLGETTIEAWTTIGLGAAVAGAVELGKAWPLIKQRWQDDTLGTPSSIEASTEEDEDEDSRTLTQRFRDYVSTVVMTGAGVILADRIAGWQLGVLVAALIAVPLSWKWLRGRMERIELFEQHQIDHEPFADTTFDQGRWISVPREAVAGFVAAMILIGLAVAAILLQN